MTKRRPWPPADRARRGENYKLLTEYDQGHNGKTADEMYSEHVESDPLVNELRAALAAQPSGPAWHDAPNAPGIWICDEGEYYEWTAHNIEILGQFDPGAGYRWFGPIPEETK